MQELNQRRHIPLVCHELTNAREALISGIADIVIDQNPEILAERCLSALLASRDTSASRTRSEAVPFGVYTSENL
jgi:hypothetical protein